MKIALRPVKPDDKNFIMATWLRGLYYSSWMQNIEKKSFFDNYPKVIEHILGKATVTCAVLEDDPDVILGYIVAQQTALHYLFVKSAFRNLGIAKKLLGNNEITHVSCITDIGNPIRQKRGWHFDPWKI